MEQLLNRHSVRMSHCSLAKQEEAPISGEYVLPEYCPDMAVILKSFAYPRLQNRQWSGDQLIVDGTAVIRVLYSDEQRSCVRSLEFAQPFSCTMRGSENLDDAAVELVLTTKYLTCRAISPRRVEVRGAVLVTARAECAVSAELATPIEKDGLYARTETVEISVPGRACEKIMTISESLEFERNLPPAEMLLGGECRAAIKECKLLAGKAIIKGTVYIHQLYTDSLDGLHTHCLDYAVPFSQIMDVSDAREGLPCKATVQVLTDTERCSVGPDGENTILEISVKMLLQLQMYQSEEVSLLYDVYDCHFPTEVQTEEIELSALLGQRYEESKQSMQVSAPVSRWQEIIDVWVQIQEYHCECSNGHAVLRGRMQIGVIAREVEGEITYHEFLEEFSTEYVCKGNSVDLKPMVIDVHYRATEDSLNLMVVLYACITDSYSLQRRIISSLHLRDESPYPSSKVSTLLYYADAGESVWDIARKCHTSPQCVMEENVLSSEILTEKMVLVVPMIH